MSDGKGSGSSAFLWTVGLGAVAIGGYWLYTKQSGASAPPGSAPAPLELQGQAPSAAPVVAPAGERASFADGSTPGRPDLSALPGLFGLPVQPSGTPARESAAAAPDQFRMGQIYEYDPWRPDGLVLTAEGERVFFGDAYKNYILDHEGDGAVFHGMSDASVSDARNDPTWYNAQKTIRATVDKGKAAVYLARYDLDDIAAYRTPKTLTFGTTKDPDGWIASPNGKLFNVRVKATNEPLPPAYVKDPKDPNKVVATAYGAKIASDSIKNGYIWKAYPNNPVPGAAEYTTTNFPSPFGEDVRASAVIDKAKANGLAVYLNAAELDRLAADPKGKSVDFAVAPPSANMGMQHVRIA